MTWREKSVSVDADSEFIFKSVLGDIVIDTAGIRRKERKRPDDWEKIKSTMDNREVFEGFIPWEDVVEISTKEEFLSFPHIDVYVRDEEESDGKRRLMIFFKDHKAENYDRVDACFKTIRKMWNAYRQRNKLHTLNYSYQDNEHRLRPEEHGDQEDMPPEEKEQGQAEKEDEEENEQDEDDEDGSIHDIIDSAIHSPGKLMERFGS